MCGIVGIASPQSSPEELMHSVRKMAQPILHRGPDDGGFEVEAAAGLALGHRRLSIQDVSAAGHQPMLSASSRFHAIYNGEIYNFKTVRAELVSLGHDFRGGSDTEVMLAAFEQWGVAAAVPRLSGMFAIAVYDRELNRLTLIRDRLGEKPLYYGLIDNRFVFCSELKSLVEVMPDALKIDSPALASYLRYGYITSPHSIYQGVSKLLPGTYLEIDCGDWSSAAQAQPIRYWDLPAIAEQGQKTLLSDTAAASDELDTLLQEIIAEHSIADVPMGAFLSGGVDSTLVAAIMQSLSDKPIDTFTIGFNEKSFDEAPFARRIAEHIGSHHHELYISAEDCLDCIEKIPFYWDEPFADSSQLPAMLVARFAREKVTVCLSGDGGDEFFCGYNRYIANDALWKYTERLPLPLRQIFAKVLLSIPPTSWEKLYSLARRLQRKESGQANFGLKVHKLAQLMQFESIGAAYKFLMSYWAHPELLMQDVQEVASILDRLPNPGMLEFMSDAMLWDQLAYLPDDNLVKGDRSTMAASLEARLPLVDHRLAEFSWRVPVSMKAHAQGSKWLLRQVLYRYVPRDMIERPKMGFSVPIAQWLRGTLREWFEDLLASSTVDEFFQRQPLQNAWQEHLAGSSDHSHKLWTVAMFLSWREMYASGGSSSSTNGDREIH